MFMLAACGASGPLHVMPSPPLHAKTAAVVEAINVAAEAQIVVIGVDPGSTVWIQKSCGLFSGNEIHVAPCGTDQSLIQVELTHEIGHALGLAHSPDPASVMFRSVHQMPLDEAAASLVEELRR